MAEDFEITLGEDFERQLVSLPKVNVFKIPPLNQAEGYRCTGWESGHMFTGRIRVLVKGKSARVVIDDPSTGKLFAEAPLDHPNALEPVRDSSRYFVLRIVQGTRHAFIGIGFAERNEAFDFKLACTEAKKASDEFETSQAAAAAGPQPIKSSGTDWSLQPGQKIQINTEGRAATRKKREIAPGAFRLNP
jgi:hypothetical protein